MSATMTTVNAISKEVYEGLINDQLDSEIKTLTRIESTSEGLIETVGGKYIVFPVRKSRNHGTSYRAENVQLAAAGRQGYAQATETLRYGYQRVRVTGQLMALAEKNHQAFTSAMDREMEGAKDDVRVDMNRIIYGNPGSIAGLGTGVMAVTNATSTGTTVTVTSTDSLEVGMVIDIVDNTGAAVSGGTGKTITSIASATTFVVDAAIAGVVAARYVVRTGNWNQEPYGFVNIVNNSGTLHGINSATAGNEYWKSYNDASTTTLTELAMIKVCDNIKRAGGKSPSVIFTSLGCRRSYWNLLTTLRRYNEPKEFTGGLVGLAFNYGKDIPVVEDVDCPASHMFFIDEKQIKRFRDAPWKWEDTDGSVWKWVHDYDSFEALLKCYWQLGTHQRNAHGYMSTVTES